MTAGEVHLINIGYGESVDIGEEAMYKFVLAACFVAIALNAPVFASLIGDDITYSTADTSAPNTPTF